MRRDVSGFRNKRKRKRILITLALSVLLTIFVVLSFLISRPHPSSVLVPQPVIQYRAEFYEENNFGLAIEFASQEKPRSDIRAIIVSHHLLVSGYIAKLVKQASGRPIRTVVIIGPNHEDVGPTAIATARVTYKTANGAIRTDDAMTSRFLSDFDLRDNPSIFVKEHSVGAIVPLVQYYLPRAEVVPIVLSSSASLRDAEELGDWLSANLDDQSLVIFSIDFSHYLTEEVAHRNDEMTRRLIEARDLTAISDLNDDYVDSPATLMTALSYAEQKGLMTDIMANSNSNDFAQTKSGSTTSYFFVAFVDW